MGQRCLLILLAVSCLSAQNVEIKTKLGNVTGTVFTAVNDTKVNVFRGIPYAKPPLKELRLAKPEPYGNFTNRSLDATEFGEACLQMSGGNPLGSEDCLFLNIYSPDTSGRKSVMIRIHGGGFSAGKSSSYPGTVLAAMNDVVIVTINYRLNLFGFLTTGDSRIPGNYGLWDQRLAIQWVKDNIEDYGGDSSSITLFGESAGGRSIGFQLMTPLNNRNLFQRAITESGSSLSLTYLNREPMKVTETVARNVGCNNTSDIVNCLRTKTAAQLLSAISTVKHPFPFFPIIDGDFLRYDLGESLANFTADHSFPINFGNFGNFGSFDLLSGWNNQEGLSYLWRVSSKNFEITGKNLSQGISQEVLEKALMEYPFHNYPQSSELKKLVVDFYINYYMSTPHVLASENRSIEDRRVEVYSRIAGDVVLKLPTIQHLQLHSAANSSGQTYAFEFRHRSTFQQPDWFKDSDWLIYGADHADELKYVFGAPFEAGNNFTAEEKNLSRDMMQIWTDFAKTGNPGAEFDKFQYPREQYYTVLNTGGFEKEKYPLNDVQRIWSAMDASLLKLDHPDVIPEKPVNVTKICLTRKDTYMSGTLALTQEEASKTMTTLCVVSIVLGIVALVAIAFAVINSIKVNRLHKKMHEEKEENDVENNQTA